MITAIWRRRGLALAMVVLAGVVSACGRSSETGGGAPADAVIKVGSQRGAAKAMLLASHALDGAPYKVEWSEFPAAQHLLEALSAGAVDVGAVGDAPFMFAYAAGAKIKVGQVYRLDGGGRSVAILVQKDSPVRTVADLKGKRVATGRGSIGHYLLIRALDQAGLKLSDVTVVFLDPGGAKAALASGAVDAWSSWGPYIGIATLSGQDRILVDGGGLIHSIGFNAVTEKAVAQKHAILLDFLKRQSRAQRWANAHPEDYAQLLSKETGLPIDVARNTVQAQGPMVPVVMDDSVVRDERETLQHFKDAGAITRVPDVAKALELSLNAAVAP